MMVSRPSKFLAGFLVESEPGDPPWFSGAQEAWVPRSMPVQRHTMHCYEFHAQFRGGTVWSIGRRRLTVAPAQVLLIPPERSHHLESFEEDENHHFALGVRPTQFDPPVEGVDLPWSLEPVTFPLTRSMREIIHLFVREMVSDSEAKTVVMESAARVLAVEIHRALHPAPGSPRGAKIAQHPAIAQAVRLIDEHPDADWSLQNLARAVRVSPRRLFDLFKRELRMTPHEYHVEQRLELARRLLRDTDRPVTELALDTGFSSSQNFATAFRRYTGQTPLQYRRG
ncbi:helix-turn-helix domain-containing protein [Kiritimatiella glycovorans]|uniref:AraC family transcriptional regulator n=1 Tax=Kiritimatiella glycovorans TaxID=1307763 RepID=A0A0G3EB25_9BACT|nr:AraC family transcriptional regulator [Kiritimatiella glycovorans]AKJ63696.1 AraC family transcriptional regulator [Kiritimatiella glycovorans]